MRVATSCRLWKKFLQERSKMRTKNNNRTIRRQVMVTESMDEKILMEARRFGLSISSYLELVIGQHIARKDSLTMVDDKRV